MPQSLSLSDELDRGGAAVQAILGIIEKDWVFPRSSVSMAGIDPDRSPLVKVNNGARGGHKATLFFSLDARDLVLVFLRFS